MWGWEQVGSSAAAADGTMSWTHDHLHVVLQDRAKCHKAVRLPYSIILHGSHGTMLHSAELLSSRTGRHWIVAQSLMDADQS